MSFSEDLNIMPATTDEKEWAATVMAGTDPWITLGITYDLCRKSCFDPNLIMYVAHHNDSPCGMILIDPRGVAGSPYIKTIAVQDEFRGRGVGRSLIEFTELLLKSRNRHLFMCVSSFNTKARNLYERLGFKKVGEFEDYIAEGKSEILLYKKLH